MALPTLAELTVSCALIHDTIGFAKPESSNLKTLELIECNVSFEGLRIFNHNKTWGSLVSMYCMRTDGTRRSLCTWHDLGHTTFLVQALHYSYA
jgi:hypothetical protein